MRPMREISVFNHPLYLDSNPNIEKYSTPEILKQIDDIFNLPVIKDRTRGSRDSHDGVGETTEDQLYLGPANLLVLKDLTEWIIERGSVVLGSKVEISKSWMNRMYQGSQGRTHNHIGYGSDAAHKTPDLIAIFYLNNPLGGSNLVIVENGIAGELPSEMNHKETYQILSSTGDLILHDPYVWHAVSEHRATDPRICLVYHLVATSNKEQ